MSKRYFKQRVITSNEYESAYDALYAYSHGWKTLFNPGRFAIRRALRELDQDSSNDIIISRVIDALPKKTSATGKLAAVFSVINDREMENLNKHTNNKLDKITHLGNQDREATWVRLLRIYSAPWIVRLFTGNLGNQHVREVRRFLRDYKAKSNQFYHDFDVLLTRVLELSWFKNHAELTQPKGNESSNETSESDNSEEKRQANIIVNHLKKQSEERKKILDAREKERQEEAKRERKERKRVRQERLQKEQQEREERKQKRKERLEQQNNEDKSEGSNDERQALVEKEKELLAAKQEEEEKNKRLQEELARLQGIKKALDIKIENKAKINGAYGKLDEQVREMEKYRHIKFHSDCNVDELIESSKALMETLDDITNINVSDTIEVDNLVERTNSQYDINQKFINAIDTHRCRYKRVNQELNAIFNLIMQLKNELSVLVSESKKDSVEPIQMKCDELLKQYDAQAKKATLSQDEFEAKADLMSRMVIFLKEGLDDVSELHEHFQTVFDLSEKILDDLFNVSSTVSKKYVVTDSFEGCENSYDVVKALNDYAISDGSLFTKDLDILSGEKIDPNYGNGLENV